MNILFDIGHPAHVHLFRNIIKKLQAADHNVVVASRTKDLTTSLLDDYQIDHIPISESSTGLVSNLKEMLSRDLALYKLHKKYHFDLALGTSVSIGHLSLISRIKSINFNEDDDSAVPLYAWAAYPFSNIIANPRCLRFKYWKKKRLHHDSYHELAYLHPDDFSPNGKTLAKYGLEPHNYCIIRKSALTAHHDSQARGLNETLWQQVIDITSGVAQVISIEDSKTHQINPLDMHDLLAYAKLVVSDSQTMSAEAAVLGTPSIRFSSFVGQLSYLEELEHQYGLTFGFTPETNEEGLALLRELIAENKINAQWQIRRVQMLADKVNLNDFMLKLVAQESAQQCVE